MSLPPLPIKVREHIANTLTAEQAQGVIAGVFARAREPHETNPDLPLFSYAAVGVQVHLRKAGEAPGTAALCGARPIGVFTIWANSKAAHLNCVRCEIVRDRALNGFG